MFHRIGFVIAAAAVVFGGHNIPVQAADVAKPNVLFISVDDLNDWVGFLKGHPQARTPNMDRLAKRGMIFANAQCAAPLCCPSRAAILSGRQPFSTGIYHEGPNVRRVLPDHVLLPQYFGANGYATFGTGKVFHHTTPEVFDEFFSTEQYWSPIPIKDSVYTPDELPTKGTDNPRHVTHYGDAKKDVVIPRNRMPSDRNPNRPAGETFDWGGFDITDEEMGDGKITTWAIERIRRKHDKPFLLCVGYYRPHIPLYAPQRYFDAFPEESVILPTVLENDLDDLSSSGRRWAIEPVSAGSHATVVKHKQWKAAVAAYLACMSFVDAQIGRMLDELEKSPNASNTAIVLWADHGWHLGEKQHWGKWTGWERSTRVPLVISPPPSKSADYKVGATCQRPVGLIDLYPTLVDLCGLPTKEGLDGQSLVPLLKDPTRATRPVITTFDFGNHSIRNDRWRFIRYADGSEELYDHDADPNEWHNLAGVPVHDAVRAELRKLLPMSPAAKIPRP
jgi:arylsulfatase A-like enzyme